MSAYKGLEENCRIIKNKKVCYSDPDNPSYKWYHQSVYKIISEIDSVFLEQSPVFIDKRDTVHSASDGGFYLYKGTYTFKGNTYTFSLQPVSCEYCDKKEHVPKTVVAKKVKNGLLIKGVFFKSLY